MVLTLLDRVKAEDLMILSDRHKKELWVCSEVLSEEELSNISSLRVGYKKAKDRLVEEIIKNTDPAFYDKVTTLDKVPIFDIETLVADFKKKSPVQVQV